MGIDDMETYVFDLNSKRETLNILRSSGESRSTEDFPILEAYLNDAGNFPFVKSYDDLSVDHISMVRFLEEMKAEPIFMKEIAAASETDTKLTMTVEKAVYRVQKGYFLQLSAGYHDSNSYEPEDLQNLENSPKEHLVMISSVILLCPPRNSPIYSVELEQQLQELIQKNVLRSNTSKPCIGMICKENNFYIKDFYITKNYTLNNIDLHYGKGFQDFHNELLSRLKSDPKGLVLFHGHPGTGKTYYIRNLIKDLIKIGKHVIYFPPNMVGHLVSPEIMTFLSQVVLETAESGKSCVLLLEDAEPLLVSRNGNGRSDGITNLLNLTDGLLNDMLSMQVIATFNTDLDNIDEALLRPERMIARKEFKKLSPEDANKLAKSIGLDKTYDTSISLAEIYSQRKAREILVHEYTDQSKRKIGF